MLGSSCRDRGNLRCRVWSLRTSKDPAWLLGRRSCLGLDRDGVQSAERRPSALTEGATGGRVRPSSAGAGLRGAEGRTRLGCRVARRSLLDEERLEEVLLVADVSLGGQRMGGTAEEVEGRV